ncbi:CAMK family protein kinase [Tritrichomonas foetus]|uniref:CAMK family protein kinase n=1 Tax=Tritrichomonas foetus TaxID=1144522 RepID=A0A1J4JGM0_9EUKA|nr:CAMK family protein kinase [Tritrichomonas foetus]|eukprot:OHS96356.1 CAMK family protein kinase [Tritrichomonas foetus]
MKKTQRIGDYVVLYPLGTGTTGKVKLGEHFQTHKHVAIKIIKKQSFEKKPQLQAKVHREIALMRVLDHPHLLKLIEVCESQRHLYIILEFAQHGELFDYLVSRRSIPLDLALKFFRQIIYGLEFLHEHAICHRDLKPENILLDENDDIKIGDFGFARWMKSNIADTSCGSPHYAAPEVIRGIPYDGRAADIWSCGVILYALVAVCIFLCFVCFWFIFFFVFFYCFFYRGF